MPTPGRGPDIRVFRSQSTPVPRPQRRRYRRIEVFGSGYAGILGQTGVQGSCTPSCFRTLDKTLPIQICLGAPGRTPLPTSTRSTAMASCTTAALLVIADYLNCYRAWATATAATTDTVSLCVVVARYGAVVCRPVVHAQFVFPRLY